MKIFYILLVFSGVLILIQPDPVQSKDFLQKPMQPEEGLEEDIPDWQARWELARLLSYMQRYEEAIAQYEQLLQEKPDLTEAKQELARIYYWDGQLKRSEELFEKLPREDLSKQALLDRAELHVAREEYQEARAIYTDYLEQNPRDHQIRFRLARVLSWQGKYDDSLKEYEIILKDRPDDVQLRRQYAQVLIWAERFDQAIIELEKTLED